MFINDIQQNIHRFLFKYKPRFVLNNQLKMGSGSSNVYDLYCYCPACPSKEKNHSKPSTWQHTRCGQRSTINRAAHVGCKGTTIDCKAKPFIEWYWKCENHSNEYKKADPRYLVASIARAGSAIAGSRNGYPDDVFREILSALADQCLLIFYIYIIYYLLYNILFFCIYYSGRFTRIIIYIDIYVPILL